nr:hypothetical protein [Tanacetum cinerariifolium]
MYDAFDKFTHIKGESLLQYYLRLIQQINDMHIYNMKPDQFQVNTKFLNSVPPEWTQTTTNDDGTSTSLIPGLVTTKEKVQKKNDVKARSFRRFTNEVNTTYGVSTANTQVSPTSTQVSIANLSDGTVYAFLASQPDGKITINGSDTAGYDKSNVECFNCHELGHFAREYRQPKNQDSRNKNQDSSRRTVNVEETSSKAMVVIDGVGSQIPDKSRKGVGFVCYNAVPPPPTGLFSPPKHDLSKSGLEEFQQPEFEGYGPKTSNSVSKDISNEVKESLDSPLGKELVSDDKLEKKIVFPTVAKIDFVRPKQQEKPVRNQLNTECVVLSPDLKLLEETQVLFRVPRKNNMTRIVKETLHITFLENKPNVARSGPTWLFDIDILTKSMNYKPVVIGNQSNGSTENDANVNSTNSINTVSLTANVASVKDNDVDKNIVYRCVDNPNMPNLEEIVYSDDDKDVGADADMTNLDKDIPSIIPQQMVLGHLLV